MQPKKIRVDRDVFIGHEVDVITNFGCPMRLSPSVRFQMLFQTSSRSKTDELIRAPTSNPPAADFH